jgi:multicomponent Na+:H+ antiporter subunit A
VLGDAEQAKDLKLWAGVNLALMLSIATFAAGAVLYLLVPRIRAAMPPGWGFDSDIGWDRFLNGLKAFAGWQTGILQSGRLTRYMAIIFASLALVLGLAIWLRLGADALRLPEMPYLLVKEWAVGALIVAGTVTTLATGSRIAAICGLGVVGIGVALIFIVYGAPDVASTQLLGATLVVVLVAVAVLRLPRLERDAFRPFHAALAGALGFMVAVILLRVVEQPFDKRLTQWFEITAWPEAYGRNIVNVILVDFRALDTFGEVAVVAVAALAGFALLKGRVSK